MTKTREAAWSSTYNAHTEKKEKEGREERKRRAAARALSC